MKLKIEYLPLDEIVGAEANPKKHSSQIGSSIDRFGFADAPIRDERTGRLVAGHGRVESLRAMRARGEGPPEGIDPTWLVPVQVGWSSRSDQEASAFLVAHNRLTEQGGWDEAGLLELVSTFDDDMTGVGFTDEDLAAIADGIEAPEVDPPEGEDTGGEEPPAEPVSERGEVYALGPHRLMCGDSTSAEDVAALLGGEKPDVFYGDPPYGMSLDPRYDSMHSSEGHRDTGDRFEPVIGDDEPFDPQPIADLWGAAEEFWWGADYYRARLPEGGSWVVWDKRSNDKGMDLDSVIGSSFELCWSKVKHKRDIARVLWSGHHGMQGGDTKSRVHPTQKPTDLAEWFFARWAPAGCVIVDPFLGSGTTLIAAAKTGRVCYGMEISPAYCDVIRKRWGDWARSAGVDPGSGAL